MRDPSPHDKSQTVLTELATEYSHTHNPEVREKIAQMIEKNVQISARAIYRSSPYDNLRLDEMESDGWQGALYALEHFNPAEGSFRAYLITGIKNRIKAGIKKRGREKRHFRSLDVLTSTKNRGYGTSLKETLESNSEENPCRYLQCSELFEQLRLDLQEIPLRDRMILEHYFFDETSFTILGRMTGLCRERIRQIKNKYIRLPCFFRRTKRYLGLPVSFRL